MDKQRDFEKGWEEYKAKKKKAVEEIGQDIADICSDMALNCCGSTPCYACIAKRLERKGYRKIPENAVVLTKEEYEKLLDVRTDVILKDIDKVFKEEFEDTKRSVERKIKPIYKAIETRTRKETAEKLLDEIDYESNGQTKSITDLFRKKYGV